MSSLAGLRMCCFIAIRAANTAAGVSVRDYGDAVSHSYMSAALAQRDIGQFLMERYDWRRPHRFNDGLAPAVAEEKLNSVSGIS